MYRIDGRLLVSAAVAVFLVGAGLGFVVSGDGGPRGTAAADEPGTSTPAATDPPGATASETPTTSATATPVPTTSATATPVPTTEPSGQNGTPTTAATPTSEPTPTPTARPPPTIPPTASDTPRPTAEPTPTPIPAEQFDAGAIERELRRLIDDWRTRRGLDPYTHEGGLVVADLNAMARAHSESMAAAGETYHVLDDQSSADRYREHDLYYTCRFRTRGTGYMLTPERNRFEALAGTHVGTVHESPSGTAFHDDERLVARAIFERWRSNAVYDDRLLYPNANRIGVGVVITEDNAVYATANVCGV